MSTLFNDIKFSIRLLGKRPGFTVMALIMLAIGIGANTIMFSIVNVFALRAPQIKEPDRLVECRACNFSGNFPYELYRDLRDNNTVFSKLMARVEDPELVTLVQGNYARRTFAWYVSANYFSTLGVSPLMGRTFRPEEERHGNEPVAVLSFRCWQKLGADPNLVGQILKIERTPVKIIGVAPERFAGTSIVGPNLWLPLGSYSQIHQQTQIGSETAYYPSVDLVARLKPGVSRNAAQAQWQSLLPRVQATCAQQCKRDCTLFLQPLARIPGGGESERAKMTIACLFLLGISFVVLLIACLNLANMVIIQGTMRHREIAIRLAIGGGRLHIIRQLLVESLLLAGCGGFLGLILAYGGTQVINTWVASYELPLNLTGALEMRLDSHVLGATLLFSVVATLLFGLRPALCLSSRNVFTDLKAATHNTIAALPKWGRWQSHSVSVTGQIALSVVLVLGAGLFTRSALQALQADPDYSMDNKIVLEIDPHAAGYTRTQCQTVQRRIIDHLQSLPATKAISVSLQFTLSGSSGFKERIREYIPERSKESDHILIKRIVDCTVGEDYFQAMDIPLLQGRSFGPRDREPHAEKVVIIEESLAKELRPDGNVLGSQIQHGRGELGPPLRVVGIVANLNPVTTSKEPRYHIYEPLGHDKIPKYIHILTENKKSTVLLLRIRQDIRKLDSECPILWLSTLADFYRRDPAIWLTTMAARLSLIFGLMALFLASLGIYAIKGFTVAARTPEFGIRRALGATQRDIVGLVLSEGTTITFTGLVLGLSLGLAGAHLLRGLLYGVNPIDPTSILVTVCLLGLASLLAGLFPARRAARIDPMEALRYE